MPTEFGFKPEHLQHYFEVGVSYGLFISDHQMSPEDYLIFARNDQLDENTPRSLINAVSNAKRAFHGRVEMLCDAFGWKQLNGKKRAAFSQRLDFLKACGVISPNILRKLNVTRNKVEHDYHVPENSQVEDYLDVVELFLIATKDLLHRFPEQIDFELMDDEYLDKSLNLPPQVFVGITLGGGMRIKAATEELNVAAQDPSYFAWLSSAISQYLL